MANASRLGSALLSVKTTLASFPELLESAARADPGNPKTTVKVATDLRSFFKHLDVHAKVVTAELQPLMQLIARPGVSAARQFAAATSVLRVFHDTAILPSIQGLCEEISRICGNLPSYPATARLAILSFVQHSCQWIAGALNNAHSHVDHTLKSLALGTHGQVQVQSSHYDLPMQTLYDLSAPQLLKALLGLFPAVRAAMDQAVSDANSMPRRCSPMDLYAQYGQVLYACAHMTEALTYGLLTRTQQQHTAESRRINAQPDASGCVEVRQGSDSSSAAVAAGSAADQVRYVTGRVDALREAGWLAGLCAAVVDMPHPGPLCKRQRDRDAEGSGLEMAMMNAHEAFVSIGQVMSHLCMLAQSVDRDGGAGESSTAPTSSSCTSPGGNPTIPVINMTPASGIGTSAGTSTGIPTSSTSTPTPTPALQDVAATLPPLLVRVCALLLHPDVVRLQRAGLARLHLHAGSGDGAGDEGSSSSSGAGCGDGSGLSGSGCAGGREARGGAAPQPYEECGSGGGGEGWRSEGNWGTGGGPGGPRGVNRGDGGGGAAPSRSTSSRSSSAARKEGKRCGPQPVQEQRQQKLSQEFGEQQEHGVGYQWAVTAYEAATGRLCTGTLQRMTLRQMEVVHLGAIHSSLGVWRLLHTHRPWLLLPDHPDPGVLPSVYDTARLSTDAARAMQRILHDEGTFGRQPSAAREQPAGAVLPRNIVYLQDLAWGDLALGWEGLGAAGAQRCMPYWLEAGGVALGLVVEAVEAGAGAGAGAGVMEGELAKLAAIAAAIAGPGAWVGASGPGAGAGLQGVFAGQGAFAGAVAQAGAAGPGEGLGSGARAGAGAGGGLGGAFAGASAGAGAGVGGMPAGAGTVVGGATVREAVAEGGVGRELMTSVQCLEERLGADRVANALTLLKALESLLHGVPGGLPASYRQLPLELRTHSARRLHAARLLPTLDRLLRMEARGALDGCTAQAANADPAPAQRTVHGLVCSLLTGLGEQGPGDDMPDAVGWRWGLCDVRLQQGLRAQAVGLAVTAAKWARRVAAEVESLPLSPPPPRVESTAPSKQRASAVAQQNRREWVCQLRRALGCLSLLAVLVRVMLPALGEQQEAEGEAGEGQRQGAIGGEAAAAVEAGTINTQVQLEALSLCLRVGCQLAAAVLHAIAHQLQQEKAQGAGRATGSDVLMGGEVHGAVGDALGLVQVLGACAAELPQLPPRELLAAQPQRLVAACCEAWGELGGAAQLDTGQEGGRGGKSSGGRGGLGGSPKTACAAALGCKLGTILACTLARLGTRPQLRPYLRAWLAPQAAVEAAAHQAGVGGGETDCALAAAAAEYARVLLSVEEPPAGGPGRKTPDGAGNAGGSGNSGAGGSGGPGVPPCWGTGVLNDAVMQLLAAASAAEGGGGGAGSGPQPLATLGMLREAARGDAASWEDACRQLADSQRVAMEKLVPAPQGASAPLLPGSTHKLEEWVGKLRGEVHVRAGGEAAAKRWELPHTLPPALGGAAVAVGYGGLRLCGNPCCGNFAGAAEAELHLKHCAGCMVVRYCGADCQRAHWREGHRRECKVLREKEVQHGGRPQ